MNERIRFFLSRLHEQLWIRPLVMCIASVGTVFFAKTSDYLNVSEYVPSVSLDTTETLLTILGTSMLVIATFAVGSMVASYDSASRTATPRSLPLVIADDVSQNALSGFIGAFIFCIVALVALKSGLYAKTGQFVLLCATLTVFAGVILIFIRWVDCIARLGRLGGTSDKVEKATASALEKRKRAMTLGGLPVGLASVDAVDVCTNRVGYVQRVQIDKLQRWAEELQARIEVTALPGTFIGPHRPVARVSMDEPGRGDLDTDRIINAFVIDDKRTFEDDPRFGLIVLAEIAGRALSPAVNDPGTAIDIIGTFVRLFVLWNEPVANDEKLDGKYDRVFVPEIQIDDLFDDAFTSIARDGAGTVEVAVRLQKALRALADSGDPEVARVADHHARQALKRAESALDLSEDLVRVRAAGGFGNQEI